MIDGYRIVAGTFLTNAVVGGYYPMSRYCLESIGKADYVDDVLVADGQSIDGTQEAHSKIPKVTWTEAPCWSLDSFTYHDTAQQYKQLFKWCAQLNERVVLTINWGDTVLLDDYRAEFKIAVEKFIRSDGNFMPLPGGSKVLCKGLRTREYGTPDRFYTLSAYRFEPGRSWTEIVDYERRLVGTDQPKIFRHAWKSTYYTYEMFTFTRKNLEDKIKKHCEWNRSWTIDQTIREKVMSKAKRLGTVKMTESDHPPEVKPLLKILTEDHYGWSCFGNVT